MQGFPFFVGRRIAIGQRNHHRLHAFDFGSSLDRQFIGRNWKCTGASRQPAGPQHGGQSSREHQILLRNCSATPEK
jgi:hypothetical protein